MKKRKEKHLAGYYVRFEEENGSMRARLKRGILSLRDGVITRIREYAENEPDTVYLDPNCVILPGLLDLHSHFGYNSIQIWTTNETDIPWDNRFEWRPSANKNEVIRDKAVYLEKVWPDALYPEDESIRKGDLVTYFTELKAVSGKEETSRQIRDIHRIRLRYDFIHFTRIVLQAMVALPPFSGFCIYNSRKVWCSFNNAHHSETPLENGHYLCIIKVKSGTYSFSRRIQYERKFSTCSTL